MAPCKIHKCRHSFCRRGRWLASDFASALTVSSVSMQGNISDLSSTLPAIKCTGAVIACLANTLSNIVDISSCFQMMGYQKNLGSLVMDKKLFAKEEIDLCWALQKSSFGMLTPLFHRILISKEVKSLSSPQSTALRRKTMSCIIKSHKMSGLWRFLLPDHSKLNISARHTALPKWA